MLQSRLSSDIAALDVAGLTADSRKVMPGTLFFAMPGSKADGLSFAGQAVAAGACAIVADRQPETDPGVPVLVARTEAGGARAALAHAAARLYPRQPGTIVAITGTSGKTSVSVFTRQLWHALGVPGASLGTIGTVTHKGARYGSLTTPDPVELHETLQHLADEGVTHLAMEASSHGLDQHRLDGARLKASAFLNLSRDHLDYHGTMRSYFAAKMALFTRLAPQGSTAVIAGGQPWRSEAAAVAKAAGLKPFIVGRRDADIAITSARRAAHGQDLTFRIHGRSYDVHLPLIGAFQASNALAAAALCISTGSDERAVIAALASLQGVPGRLEKVGEVHGAPVLVDYAHKPAALATVLDILKPYATGRLISVFGCGGDRDAGKRPMMGRISADRADVTIVTDDNPRSEEPALIRKAILAAAPGACEIGDRAEAIGAAVAMLKQGDVLVIAGKGHEEGQIIGKTILPFSDHAVARAAILKAGGQVTG
ncbi:MAG: UDP-N-acetylmuramoyl-L-alanyl-D-glutamate--2,6-diaminopimelate ligase [Methylocystis sp.]|nr:UDP-N-acetylmuramoyl-L-alanyl-D-glutamate--2,6-diaminopimelate ligase [Methylocystis sp.]MCA3583359.1 UDP-N-acetylmuramoyl-L-alanyl-D-glutamate--2,6-diaminopimelate ligase [Methylocystis sp.]MCA3591878.1 UDP-N-acetylmuramoyl-L-alanyl-D-glutamate--2,6-diaminopimelate ligase [Methylocystis sp.]